MACLKSDIEIGYVYFFADKMFRIFKLNIEIHPESDNAYDSLCEAYMKNGDTQKVIENDNKSLKRNPDNSNAREMLKKRQH